MLFLGIVWSCSPHNFETDMEFQAMTSSRMALRFGPGAKNDPARVFWTNHYILLIFMNIFLQYPQNLRKREWIWCDFIIKTQFSLVTLSSRRFWHAVWCDPQPFWFNRWLVNLDAGPASFLSVFSLPESVEPVRTPERQGVWSLGGFRWGMVVGGNYMLLNCYCLIYINLFWLEGVAFCYIINVFVDIGWCLHLSFLYFCFQLFWPQWSSCNLQVKHFCKKWWLVQSAVSASESRILFFRTGLGIGASNSQLFRCEEPWGKHEWQ